ncbi:MAG: glycosyltransferase family 2 protein [candidate division WOR-3 bacterium]|nr:glycosyltransferase family 2 protein [candidate division WOR-3 bacterium]
MIKLSIVIISFNTRPFILKCVNSILKNYNNDEFEIIIVDNASQDDSISELQLYYNNIKLIKNINNVGYAKANNQAIKIAKGQYVLLLNPDTIVFPNTLTRVIDFMDNNPQVGVVSCKVILPNGKIDPACHRGFPTPWASFCYFVGLEKLFPKNRLFGRYHLGWLSLDTIHEIDTPSGCFYMIRKSLVEEVGLLDENYFLYYEEVDWSYRIKKRGWKIYFLPDVKIIHYKGASSGIKKSSKKLTNVSKQTKKMAINAFCNSMKYFYNKHYKTKHSIVKDLIFYLGVEIKRYVSLLRLQV